MLRTLTATRYVTPLREGGSLPAIVEADDDGLYVLKFRGAGQGPKALIAEMVAGEIARALELPVPEIVFAELDSKLGRSEPDFEIQALIKASAGLNLALDYLPGAIAFDALDARTLDPLLASSIVWFDAYVTARRAIPICYSGTSASCSSTTGPRSTSITRQQTIWNVAERPLRPLSSMCYYQLPASLLRPIYCLKHV